MNYLPYLEKKTWSLSEAVGLVSGIFDKETVANPTSQKIQLKKI